MFRRKHRSTGKISFMILCSGLVVFTVLMTTVLQLAAGYRAEQRLLYDTTLELNQATAKQMAVTMNSLIRSMKSSLRYGGEAVGKTWEDAEGAQARLDLLREGGGMLFNSMLLVSADGVVRTTSPSDLGLQGKTLSSAAGQEALRSRATYVSEPYVGATGRLIVLLSEPIFAADGAYLGMLAGTVYLEQSNVLSDAFGTGTILASGSYTYIVDGNGNLVYHPDSDRLGESVVRNPVVQELMRGREGRMQVTNTRGRAFLAGYYPVEENGWGIVSQTPLTTVERALARQTWSRLAYAVPLCLLMLVAAVYLARRLAEPFVVLSGVARKLSDGERVSESLLGGHWNREADALGKSMLIAMRAMQQHRDRLTTEAMTDPLTGLPNRRAMNEAVERRIAAGEPFALLVMDIDRFKAINDTYGHAVGDEVLRFLAETAKAALRPSDRCYRFGGEEFVVLLPELDAATAYPAAERLRGALERTPSPAGRPVTVSIGLAEFPADGVTPEQVFEAADEAMYRAKQEGRNRTLIAKRDRA